eukprot:TRINITY_DN38440_c0_g1_i1.p1 TRINITY_DN38440_c0_g1~~TRINITY_DN38440_c0_g1_i1.p1  ORF type:complete len:550 (+),score=50.28 TRINITY_DN38440_c0_g1_i1:115-1764(+)
MAASLAPAAAVRVAAVASSSRLPSPSSDAGFSACGFVRRTAVGDPTAGRHGASARGDRRAARVVRAAAAANDGAKASTKKAEKAKGKAKDPPPKVEVTEAEEENSRVRLTVTVPTAICGDVWQKTIRDLTQSSQIKGFRKGDRVPEWLLVREYGERPVKLQALDLLLKTTLTDAMATVAGRALKDSEHISSNVDDLVAAYAADKPLSYEVTVDVAPAVKWHGERPYASLAVEVEAFPDDDQSALAAADERIRAQLKGLGRLTISLDKGLKQGDVAIVDVESHRITADGGKGDPILSATQKGFQLDTDESAFILPGMVAALMGIERGQTREFELTFPADWQVESLRNLPAKFTVACQELFIRELPELTDELAPKFLADATTIDDVRQRVADAWKGEQRQKQKAATMAALVERLGEVCAMEVPNSLLEEQGRQMYGAKLIELQTSGRIRKEDVDQLMTEQMVANYLRSQKDKIERQVKQALAVQEVFRAEGLTVTEEEIAAESASAIAEFQRFNQEFDEARVKEQAVEMLEGNKVFDWLASHATVTYKESA